MGFPGGSDGKESACSAGDGGWITGLGRSLGEGKASILAWRISWTEDPMGYSPWGHKESSLNISDFANSPKNVLMSFVEVSFPSFLFFQCRIQSKIIYCIVLVAMSQIFKNRNLITALAYWKWGNQFSIFLQKNFQNSTTIYAAKFFTIWYLSSFWFLLQPFSSVLILLNFSALYILPFPSLKDITYLSKQISTRFCSYVTFFAWAPQPFLKELFCPFPFMGTPFL